MAHIREKATRSIKVMVKKLHPSTSTTDIAEKLNNNSFKIREVVHKLKRTTVNSKIEFICLPLCMLCYVCWLSQDS